MGRWGDGIYESDWALDYLLTITQHIERELSYWLSPEQLENDSRWIAQMLTIMELMLLFDQFGHGIHLETKLVERWRGLFFRVWDGDWKDSYKRDYLYEALDYRKNNRFVIVAMFDRLESIARFWEPVSDSRLPPELVPLHPDYPIPHFSLNRVFYRDNREVVHIEYFIRNLIETRVQEITYWLAYYHHWIYVTGEEILVAVDVLGFLCEVYGQSPIVSQELVRTWRTSTIQIFKNDSYGEEWGESDAFYQNILKSFARLEAMAKKYPPQEW